MNEAELKKAMGQLPEPVTAKKPPHWEYWRRDLYLRVLNSDPYGFFGWPCIYHTMLINHWKNVALEESVQLPESYREYATWPRFGQPSDVMAGTPLSMNLLHHVFHLYSWEQIGLPTCQINSISSVLEIGGGYGAMPLVMRRMGVVGPYAIFDLPEFSLLQQYYLANTQVPEVDFYSDLTSLQSGVKEVDMLIACYSLSEMSLTLREQILERVHFKNALFLFSRNWEEYDNWEYFTELGRKLDHIDWYVWESPYLPQGNIYLFGHDKNKSV